MNSGSRPEVSSGTPAFCQEVCRFETQDTSTTAPHSILERFARLSEAFVELSTYLRFEALGLSQNSPRTEIRSRVKRFLSVLFLDIMLIAN